MEPSYNSGQRYTGMRPGGTFSSPNIPSPAPMPLAQASKKPRKGLIIGLILAVVALIVTVVVVLTQLNRGGGQASAEDSDFYRYANYLINGTESTNTNIGERDDGLRSFAVVEAFYAKDTAYFDKLNKLWKKVYEPIVSDEESSSENGPVIVTAEIQNSAIEFLTRYLQMRHWPSDDILQLYTENGYNGAIQIAEEDFSSLKDTTYDVGIKAYEGYANYLKSALRIIASYDDLGCITEGIIDNDCVAANMGALSDSEFATYDGGIRDAEDYALDDLLDACYGMSNLKGDK